jgi:predicted nucleotidyltransferase
MKVGEWNVLKMIVFRENMGSRLFLSSAERIFGKELVRNLDERIKRLLVSGKESAAVARKLEYARQNSSIFLIFDLVKFVGVSGSVAAGFAGEDDDIDIFIVVRNGTGWLYRGLLLLRNLFNRKIRMGGGFSKRHTGLGGRFKDKFCINLIVEERGLKFDEDIYNEKYLGQVLSKNTWISKYAGIVPKAGSSDTSKEGFIWHILNAKFFIAQLIYRILMLHPTDLKEINRSYREGKIIFYPKDFRHEILKEFDEKYEKRVEELFGSKDDSGQ